MKTRFYMLQILMCFAVFGLYAQNAPVSAIKTIVSSGLTLTVPVTATEINNIGSCNLQFLYDPEVVTCTLVEKGPSMPGNIASNIETPGIITLGWFTWPGVSLPDHAVLFDLHFEKAGPGVSDILWSTTYPDKQWSDGSFNLLADSPLEEFYHNGSVTFLENAPTTFAPYLSFCSAMAIDVPITVSSFVSIGAISLTLNFNESALDYVSFTNDSNFPGLFITNPANGIITVAGFDVNSGITLPDNTTLFTLHFNYLGGYSELIWFDDGPSCEYAGPPPTYIVLNDTPQSSFYINGSISEIQVPSPAGMIAGPEDGNVCTGATGIEFNVPPISNATSYNWSLPEGATISGGGNTNEITVDFSNSAVSGNVFVFGINDCGNGEQSQPFLINVNNPPSILQQPVTPDTVEAGQGIASFSVLAEGLGLTYNWQEYTTSWEPLSNDVIYNGVFSSTLTITGPGPSMNENKYRCIVAGFCEPSVITDGLATLYVSNLSGVFDHNNIANTNGIVLSANPNPFDSEITFNYQLPDKGDLTLEIMNIRGDLVVLLSGKINKKGSYNQHLSLDNLISGIYLARIRLITETNVLSESVKILCKK